MAAAEAAAAEAEAGAAARGRERRGSRWRDRHAHHHRHRAWPSWPSPPGRSPPPASRRRRARATTAPPRHRRHRRRRPRRRPAPTAAPAPGAGAERPVARAGATPRRPRPAGTAATYRSRLGSVRGLFSGAVSALRSGRIDAATWDSLEEALIRADVGVATTNALLDDLRAKVDGQGDQRRRRPARGARRLHPPAARDAGLAHAALRRHGRARPTSG